MQRNCIFSHCDPPCVATFLYGLRYPGPASLVDQPRSQEIRFGQTAHLSVVASSEAGHLYQWYAGRSGDVGSPIDGGYGSSLITPNLTTNSAFWVRIISAEGFTDSDSAFVTVFPADQPFLHLSQSSGQPSLVIEGPTNVLLRLEFKADFAELGWRPWLELSLSASPFMVVDTNALGARQRFYRVVKL